MAIRHYGLVFLAWALAGCGSDDAAAPASGNVPPVHKVDRSTLTDLGTDPLDYTDPNFWACLPGNDPNECHTNLDATVFAADGTSRVVKHVPAANPAFDCFYVYPTVDLESPGNTNSFADLSHVRDALYSQGAQFSSLCEVYAPLYRQQAISTATSALVGSADLAFGDVEAAFDEYLETWNKGRKFVLMGHSQGTFLLQRLIIERLETDDALRAKMISALLIGGLPTVPNGQLVGGSLKKVPACSSPGETGCVIAYNAYPADVPPPTNAFFGRGDASSETICTTPGPLANNPGRSRGTYLPKVYNTALFKPDTPAGEPPPFDTAFAVFPDVFKAECVRETVDTTAFHYLKVTLDPASGDKRMVAPYRSTVLESVGFGLHVSDYNMVLDDLIEAVKLQSAAALR